MAGREDEMITQQEGHGAAVLARISARSQVVGTQKARGAAAAGVCRHNPGTCSVCLTAACASAKASVRASLVLLIPLSRGSPEDSTSSFK